MDSVLMQESYSSKINTLNDIALCAETSVVQSLPRFVVGSLNMISPPPFAKPSLNLTKPSYFSSFT